MTSLSRSISHILSGRLIRLLIGVGFTPILVRVISQEQYGIFASIMAALGIVSLISRGGLFDSIRKSIAEYKFSDDLPSIVAVSLLLSLLYGTISTLTILLTIYLNIIPQNYEVYGYILLGSILFGNVFIFSRGYFYGLQKENTGEFLKISQKAIYSVSGLSLAYVGYDLIGVFAGYTFSFIIVGIAGIYLVHRHSNFALEINGRAVSYSKNLASYGGFQLIGGLSAALLYKTDILLVELFYQQTETALYQSAIVSAEMIWFVPSAIQSAFLQDTAANWSEKKVDQIESNLKSGFKYSTLSLFLFGGGLFVLADSFLTVYFGTDYVGSTPTLRILIVGTMFMGMTRPVNASLQATGWIRQTELFSIGALLLNILLNVILIPRYGIVGAGIGTAVSYIAMFGGRLLLWHLSQFKVVPLQWFSKLVLTQLLFFTIFLTLDSLLSLQPLISLIVLPPIGFILFIVINMGAGYIPAEKVRKRVGS